MCSGSVMNINNDLLFFSLLSRESMLTGIIAGDISQNFVVIVRRHGGAILIRGTRGSTRVQLEYWDCVSALSRCLIST